MTPTVAWAMPALVVLVDPSILSPKITDKKQSSEENSDISHLNGTKRVRSEWKKICMLGSPRGYKACLIKFAIQIVSILNKQ